MQLEIQSPPIELAHETALEKGGLVIEPALCLIVTDHGEQHLEPKTMQVLVTLATDSGHIFSRDDLIERCWEGKVVGDASVNRIIYLLRSALRDLPGHTLSVETVPRVGYRLREEGDGLDSHSVEYLVQHSKDVGLHRADTGGASPSSLTHLLFLVVAAVALTVIVLAAMAG